MFVNQMAEPAFGKVPLDYRYREHRPPPDVIRPDPCIRAMSL
jgi:hypothetical protein